MRKTLAPLFLALLMMLAAPAAAVECPCNGYDCSGITSDGNECLIYAGNGTCCAYICSDFDEKIACGIRHVDPDCERDVTFEFSEDDFLLDIDQGPHSCQVTSTGVDCTVGLGEGDGEIGMSLEEGGSWKIDGWYNSENHGCRINGGIGCNEGGDIFGDLGVEFGDKDDAWREFKGEKKEDGSWEFNFKCIKKF